MVFRSLYSALVRRRSSAVLERGKLVLKACHETIVDVKDSAAVIENPFLNIDPLCNVVDVAKSKIETLEKLRISRQTTDLEKELWKSAFNGRRRQTTRTQIQPAPRYACPRALLFWVFYFSGHPVLVIDSNRVMLFTLFPVFLFSFPV